MSSHWRQQVRKAALKLAVLVGCLLSCFPAFAQLNLGRITGSISDQTGGAVANATVTITDVARGTSRTLMTDAAGQYNAPSLVPGNYSVRAEAMGFQTFERQNVDVGVGADIRVDATLQPGAQTQTVTVTEALPIVDATSATLGGSLEHQELGELPINGRSVLKLLNYVPGSVTVNGNDFNLNGSRNQDQSYMFDGIDELNPYGTGPIVGGTSGFTEATILPLDAIQETTIITNPSAEYGWKYGGVVNVGIKSGSNQLHGTAFALGRDSALDTKNAFSAPNQKAQDELEQFGGTLGGAIKKDKVFYFLGYEGQRYDVATPASQSFPAALGGAGRTGSIADALADMATKSVTPSTLSLDLAGCPTVAPYTPCTGGIFNNPSASTTIPGAVPNNGGSDNGMGKVDYHLNDKNSLNGEYFIGIGTSNQVSSATNTAAEYWDTQKYTRSQLGRAVWVYTPTSSWLNEMRFGIDREHQTGHPAECTESLGQPNYATQYHFIIQPVPAPLCGFPQLSISGFTSLGTSETSGGPSLLNWTTFAGVDTVSYTHGTHQFKFGFEIHSGIFSGSTKLNYIHGRLTFGSVAAFSGASALEDFLAGQVGQSQVLVGSPLISSTYNRYAGFFQDDWRVRRDLTLNLGLRYEVVPPISGDNELGGFLPSQGLVQVGKQISSLYPTYYKAFSPRVGIAWDVNGKGRTVIRAGGSIVYDINPINSFLSPAQAAAVNIIPTGFNLYAPNGSLLTSPGTLQTANLVGVGNALVTWQPDKQVFNTNPSNLSCGNGLGVNNPNLPTGAGNPANPPPCNIQPISPNTVPGYLGTWTAGVQRAITNNASVTLAYVGSRGLRLSENLDINQPLPGVANTKTLLSEQLRRPYDSQYPYLGKITMFSSGAESRYNALQANFKLRATRGLTASFAYTYSHTLANADAEYGSYFEDSTNPRLDYAPTSYDFHDVVTTTFTYQVPGIKVPGQLLQGWEINSVISILSAQPYNVVDGSTDISGTGENQDRWSILGNPSSIVSGIAPIPCYGVPGSTFAGTSNCVTVAAGASGSLVGTSAFVANMPAACLAAASAEPSNPNVPTTQNGLGELGTLGCYYENGTAIVPPAQGTFGNMGRDLLRNGLPFREWDLSINKSWTFRERFTAQFRAEAFNVLNRPIFSTPNNDPSVPKTFGSATSINNSGDPILGTGGPRQINLGLKLTF